MSIARCIFILCPLLLVTAAGSQTPTCTYGNPQPVVSYDTGWIQADASYAQLATSAFSDCDCEYGILVRDLHCPLYFAETTTLTARARLLEIDGPAGCRVPGLVLATSGEVELDLPAGLQDVTVPCDFDCATAGENFFLVLEITTLDGAADLPYTGLDTGVDKLLPGDLCTSYRDLGGGWEDMIDAGLGGGMPITATVECCGDPIADETEQWGAVKLRYR